MLNYSSFIAKLRGGLIVSCQARAAAIRANGPADIAAIHSAVELTDIHLPWQYLFEIGFNTKVMLP